MGKSFFTELSGQVGIGTLIIFIAMVLVSAVAAAVLIQTTGVLQQKAQQTGMETITEISSNLIVDTVYGERINYSDLDSMPDNITYYRLITRVAPGAGRIDLDQVMIIAEDHDSCDFLNHMVIVDGTMIEYPDGSYWFRYWENHSFSTAAIRDNDKSYYPPDDVYIINSGDLVSISINATHHCICGKPRSHISFTIIPESGNAVRVDLTTPNSYGTKQVIRLLPTGIN